MDTQQGLALIDGLERDEQTAFLGLFAGARQDLTSYNGECPSFGKAECEWVDNWLAFYRDTLAANGLVAFHMGEDKPALGMVAGSTFRRVTIVPTDLGFEVREAWWKRHDEIVAAFAAFVSRHWRKRMLQNDR